MMNRRPRDDMQAAAIRAAVKEFVATLGPVREAHERLRAELAGVGRAAFAHGGVRAAEDVSTFIGESAINTMVSSLLVGLGFRAVLTNPVNATIGPMTPTEFLAHWEKRIASGQLRGRERVPTDPNAPPWPGAKMKKTPDFGTAEPTRFK